MSFELSFSSDFFILPGELYDGAEYPHGDRPYSVLGAIRALSDKEWANIAMEVFGMGDDMVDYLDIETVLTKIQETNTCSDLSSPVQVWIDEDGWYSILVYDHEGRPTS